MDEETTVAELRRLVDRFCEERGWQGQAPKDFAVSMAVEVGELLDHFRFRSDEEITVFLQEPEKKRELVYEIADILYHVLALASSIDFDLSASFRGKLAISEARYPVQNSDHEASTVPVSYLPQAASQHDE